MTMALRAEKIGKKFLRKNGEANFFYAVKPQDLELEAGTLTVLSGRSGSGKTTLLSILSGLLTPSEGTVYLKSRKGEENLYQLTDETRSALRNDRIGIIPQGRAVLDNLTVMENILLPQIFAGTGRAERKEEDVMPWLEQLGIAHLRDARVTELSGGEVRRVAIIRALLPGPEIIFADEPTGDLDDENTRLVLELLRREADRGAAVLLVTHEPMAVSYADRVLRMDAGELVTAKKDK